MLLIFLGNEMKNIITILLFALSLLMFSCAESKQEDARNRDEYGCHREDTNYAACRDKAAYNSDMCFNTSILLATTTGSPSFATCSNKRHKMRVEPVTKSGEEIGALVFCECVK